MSARFRVGLVFVQLKKAIEGDEICLASSVQRFAQCLNSFATATGRSFVGVCHRESTALSCRKSPYNYARSQNENR